MERSEGGVFWQPTEGPWGRNTAGMREEQQEGRVAGAAGTDGSMVVREAVRAATNTLWQTVLRSVAFLLRAPGSLWRGRGVCKQGVEVIRFRFCEDPSLRRVENELGAGEGEATAGMVGRSPQRSLVRGDGCQDKGAEVRNSAEGERRAEGKTRFGGKNKQDLLMGWTGGVAHRIIPPAPQR